MIDPIQRIREEEYQHGYYDARVKEHESQNHPAVYAVAHLYDSISAIKVMPETLERAKFFCLLSGIDQMYYEYCFGIQIANRRTRGKNYFLRIWEALLNRAVVVLAPDPKEIWLEKIAREFALAFRDCSLVADLSVNMRDILGEPHQVLFKALTWKAMK